MPKIPAYISQGKITTETASVGSVPRISPGENIFRATKPVSYTHLTLPTIYSV